jgi:hypothetical protein
MNSVRTSETAPRWSFTRDDGTPLNYTLVNIKDWCKNTFEMVDQLRINTDNSHHCYDADRNAKLCTIIQKIAEGLGQFSTDTDALGDAYET